MMKQFLILIDFFVIGDQMTEIVQDLFKLNKSVREKSEMMQPEGNHVITKMLEKLDSATLV